MCGYWIFKSPFKTLDKNYLVRYMIYSYFPQDAVHVKILLGVSFFCKTFPFLWSHIFSFMDHVLDIMHIYFKPRTWRAPEFCMFKYRIYWAARSAWHWELVRSGLCFCTSSDVKLFWHHLLQRLCLLYQTVFVSQSSMFVWTCVWIYGSAPMISVSTISLTPQLWLTQIYNML